MLWSTVNEVNGPLKSGSIADAAACFPTRYMLRHIAWGGEDV